MAVICSSAAAVCRFGSFEFNRSTGELRRAGSEIKLPLQPARVLALLTVRAGELVTREEIRRAIWGDGTFVDFELGLNLCINRIRTALGDAARAPAYIETVPRRGYRFVASVAPVWTAPLTLAVLPFENLNHNPDEDFFGDAVADALTTELGNVSTLRVISRQSVLHLKGSRKTVPEIARDLKVDVVVEGSVLVAGNSIRITTQLVQAMPEQHLWAKAYACQMGDVLTMEGQVARDIAEAVQATVTAAEIGRLSRRRPVDPEGHVAYLRARHHLAQNSLEGFQKGLRYLHIALENDPTHALAYAHMALCYSLLGFWGHLPIPEAYPRAKKAALEAIVLDDALSVAHSALGWVSWLQDWDLATCEAETLRAIDLNPSDERAHMTYAVFLAIIREDRAKALGEVKLALDLDPLSLGVNTDAAWLHLFVGDYHRALQQARTTLDLFPDALQAWYVVGWSELAFSRFDAAIGAFEKAASISRDALSVGYLGHAHARAGHLDAAASLLGELLSRLERAYVPAKPFVCLYAGLGERDRVIEWLEKAYLDRDPILFWLRAVPIFEPMAQLIQTWTRERLPHL